MAFCSRCVNRIARLPVPHTRWRQFGRRHYSSSQDDTSQNPPATHDAPSDGAWFETLREEMVNRELPKLSHTVTRAEIHRLHATLADSFPATWDYLFSPKPPADKPPTSVGNHLVYFNAEVPSERLLPDGTDTLHSPGGAFVRRMWAGGSLRVNGDLYLDHDGGWRHSEPSFCVERIKDVRLAGQDESAKIFVTIERRFARKDQVVQSARRGNIPRDMIKAAEHFGAQAGLDGWGDAFLVEERNLVFMRERSTAELEDIKAGNMKPTKYIPPPASPDVSHVMTPTSAMLFRFSALTFNAHAIHLDRDYARNVEGHRNLLVHGPLTLMLMVKFVTGHLHEAGGAPQVVQSIEYRNLAPLYCDEELRLCARDKTGASTENGRTYDVWIEGPTGGLAVKGTVRTSFHTPRKETAPSPRYAKATAESKQEPNVPDTSTASSTPGDESTPIRRVKASRMRIVKEKLKTHRVYYAMKGGHNTVISSTAATGFTPSTQHVSPGAPRTSSSTSPTSTLTRPTPNSGTGPVPLAGISVRHLSTTSSLSKRSTRKSSNKKIVPLRTPPEVVPAGRNPDVHPFRFKIRRLVAPPAPMRVHTSLLTRRLAQTIHRRKHSPPAVRPRHNGLGIVRRYAATPYPTYFEKKGAKLIVPGPPRIRSVLPKPPGWEYGLREVEYTGWVEGRQKTFTGTRRREVEFDEDDVENRFRGMMEVRRRIERERQQEMNARRVRLARGFFLGDSVVEKVMLTPKGLYGHIGRLNGELRRRGEEVEEVVRRAQGFKKNKKGDYVRAGR